MDQNRNSEAEQWDGIVFRNFGHDVLHGLATMIARELLPALSKESATILDVGAGTGTFTVFLQESPMPSGGICR